jgi:hypothetical protein
VLANDRRRVPAVAIIAIVAMVARRGRWRGSRVAVITHHRGGGYAAAGYFVTHLNTHGWQSVGSFYKKVSRDSSADDVAQAFAEVFPTSMDQAWSDARGAPGAASCQRDWECMTTAMAVGNVATLDCDGDLHRSVDVASPGGVARSSAHSIRASKNQHSVMPHVHWSSSDFALRGSSASIRKPCRYGSPTQILHGEPGVRIQVISGDPAARPE